MPAPNRPLNSLSSALRWLACICLVSGPGCDLRSQKTDEPIATEKPTVEARVDSLRSDNPQTIARAAIRVAQTCVTQDQEATKALLARAASLVSSPAQPEESAPAWDGLALAAARCAPRPEQLLISWLKGVSPQRSSATRALGWLAVRRGGLGQGAALALLQHKGPLEEAAWFALFHALDTTRSMEKRFLELARHSRHSYWATRALIRAGASAVEPLVAIGLDLKVPPSTRVAALHSLASLGGQGRSALISSLAETSDPRARLAILAGLGARHAATLRPLLEKLSSDPLPASQPLRRISGQVRCRAQALLATKPIATTGCAEEKRYAQLAQATSIEHTKLEGPAHEIWNTLYTDSDPAVKQAALRILVTDPTSETFETAIAESLSDKNGGTVSTAAGILRDVASHTQDYKLPAKIFTSLRNALESTESPASVLAQVSLIEAATATKVLSFRKQLPHLCSSPFSAVRRATTAALATLRSAECPPRTVETSALSSLKKSPPSPHVSSSTTLVFVFEDEERSIVLDSSLAPQSVASVTGWVRGGLFTRAERVATLDGHLLVLGDPDADGFMAQPLTELPHEPSATRFDAFSVGIRQRNPDAPAQQLLLTLAARPDFDGELSHIGKASKNWLNVQEGARILRVVIRESSADGR